MEKQLETDTFLSKCPVCPVLEWSLFLAFWRLPRVADMPWRGLYLYVPDISFWLGGMRVLTFIINSEGIS